MNFSELKTEFYARGTDYLSVDAAGVTRAELWLNEAYREICGLHAWPFLDDEASGTPPLSIPTLRRVRYVRLTNRAWWTLIDSTEEDLIQDGYDLTQTGLPEYYYIKGGNEIRTAPKATESITVGFIKRIDPLSGTQTPLFDEEYHGIIVDRAMIKAYIDTAEFTLAAELRNEYNQRVQGMVEDYQINTRDVSFLDPGLPYDG